MIGRGAGIAIAVLATVLPGCTPKQQAEQEFTKTPETDAEISAKAREIENSAEEAVKKVEAKTKAEIDASKAETKEAVEAEKAPEQ